MDIRLPVIKERLKNINKIICVDGVKGGIGKTLVSLSLSLILREYRKKVGLLDLDLSSPTLHLLFKKKKVFFREDKGLHPLNIQGIKFVSIYYFIRENALPLRENDVRKLIRELFVIFIWDDLDYLIIDMPPGLSSPFLEILFLIKNPNFLIITKDDFMVLDTTKKIIKFLKKKNLNILGIIENFSKKGFCIEKNISHFKVNYLGKIRFDSTLAYLKGIEALKKTHFYKDMKNIVNHAKNVFDL